MSWFNTTAGSATRSSDPSQARVFISYSRKDGAAFAAELREWLRRVDLSVWQDIIALEGGRDWWSQIEDALRSQVLQHFILVMTPAALDSTVIRREIRLARQEGKTVSPIKGPGLGNLHKVPRWIGQVYDLDLPEHRTTLIRVLRDRSRQKRVTMMAPEPPADFVQRPAEFDALKRLLLDGKGNSVAITAALRGAGGYGKTTLARSLAHDPEIQDAYFDGILWVELGEKPENLLAIVSDLITRLTGSRPGLETINAAASALGETLGDRSALLVIDDVWREQDLHPFLRGGPKTTRLVTTRVDNVLPIDTARQPIDAMQSSEALKLLGAGLPVGPVADQHLELGTLAARLGEYPLLLKLVNGFLRDRVLRSRQPLAQALVVANTWLNRKGLVAFDARNDAERTNAVARTISVSLEHLDHDQRVRFGELGVFPENTDIPIGIVGRLWAATGGLDELETEELLSELYGLSLLSTLDLDRRTLDLHDVIRQFLQEQAGHESLAVQHQLLLKAIDDDGWLNRADTLTRRYYYLYRAHHLAEARDRRKLDALLLDAGWLQAKLVETRDFQSLVGDYERHAIGEEQSLIGRTLRLTIGICARSPRQLLAQVLGRLMLFENVIAAGFLDSARLHLPRPNFLTLRPSLTPPGAEVARLEGHLSPITALCVLPDGRISSGSWDKTIRLWDVKGGAETTRLVGHSFPVSTLCALRDGRLASGSYDNTIRLWDLESASATTHLVGHSSQITALCALSDGYLASGSYDRTIRIWDTKTGGQIACLEGHSDSVNALCMLPDGRVASAGDNTVRLWNLKTGAETGRLEGHTAWVSVLCTLPDGRVASGSGDNTIRLWEIKTGAETARLDGHTGWVSALCVLPAGNLASGSDDKTIRLWDVKTATELRRLEGHSEWITALRVLPDGRLASSSGDKTIRLWDVKTSARSDLLERHSGPVTALCTLLDGRLASGSADHTIRLWDVKTASEIARLEGHRLSVTALCQLPDGKLISSSNDSTIRIWDVNAASEVARLEGHSDPITALCLLTDGRLVSGAGDDTIRIWDLLSGAEMACLKGHSFAVPALHALPDGRVVAGCGDNKIQLLDMKSGAKAVLLEGHSEWVKALCVLPDGRLTSGSADRTIRLWDVKTASETARLEGHSASVNALCMLPDGRLVSGSGDNTIRLWDTVTLNNIASLEFDAPVNCLVLLLNKYLVAGDHLGRLHWLEIVD
jgi:WD40 repeat protein